MSKIRAVIDTNVLIKTINRGNFEFSFTTTSILDEYEEKLTEFYSAKTAHLVLEILCTADNVLFSEPHFPWNLIEEDPDDNKFADLAISSNADCLVTFDKHFDIFKEIDFPRLTIVKPAQFSNFFQTPTANS